MGGARKHAGEEREGGRCVQSQLQHPPCLCVCPTVLQRLAPRHDRILQGKGAGTGAGKWGRRRGLKEGKRGTMQARDGEVGRAFSYNCSTLTASVPAPHCCNFWRQDTTASCKRGGEGAGVGRQRGEEGGGERGETLAGKRKEVKVMDCDSLLQLPLPPPASLLKPTLDRSPPGHDLTNCHHRLPLPPPASLFKPTLDRSPPGHDMTNCHHRLPLPSPASPVHLHT